VFGSEDAVLVQGAGTGAVRLALFATVPAGGSLLVHDAPTYLTSRLTLEAMGVRMSAADFNDPATVTDAVRRDAQDALLIQHMRPFPEDRYEIADVVSAARAAAPDLPVVCDDNYAPLKVERLGVGLGANVSAFSLFKLGGPQGVGCVLGEAGRLEQVRRFMLSGGSVVQGDAAIAALCGLARAALPMAWQAQTTLEVADRLRDGEVPGIVFAFACNTPETIVLAELDGPYAEAVRAEAAGLGAAIRPVGMESQHEVAPAVLRPSKAMIERTPGVEDHVLRLSAMRAGADLVVGMLRKAVARARGEHV
jgi:cystathionine beta-lyase/cystathionine gamma-synthase